MSTTTLQTARPSIRTALLGVLGAVVAAIAVWAVATVAGVDLAVRFGDGAPIDVTVVSVAMASLVASLAGWGLLVVLGLFTAQARTVWTVIASIATLASLGGPLSTTASSAAKVSLIAMHLAVAAVLILTLRRTARN